MNNISERIISVNSNEEKCRLLDYIGDDYLKVPYLYLDLEKYGIGTENVKTWYSVNKNNEINCIFLLYFDCLHIYSRNYSKEILDLIINEIKKNQPHTIITVDEIGKELSSIEKEYNSIKSYVITTKNISIKGIGYKIEMADYEDIDKIVDLFFESEHYRLLYSKDLLRKQLEQRFNDKFGRIFIIRNGEKIDATMSIYGENEKIAITSGLVASSKSIRPGLSVSLIKGIENILRDENKINLGFISNEDENLLKFNLKIGAEIVATYYKLLKN